MDLTIVHVDEITLDASEPLARMYHLSPYVWTEGEQYELALRAVNRSDDPSQKVARIYHGSGNDGRHFVMDEEPIIAAGPDDADAGGCEDPSVVRDRGYHVFYSGYNPKSGETTMHVAVGRSIHRLEKRGQVLSGTRYRNAKEAALFQAADGSW